LCGALVSAVLAVVAGRGGTAGGTRSGGRSYFRVALGTVLCPRTPAQVAGASQTDQQVLAWSMRLTFGSRGAGATCIEPSIPAALRLTSCCQRCAMPQQPNGFSARLSAMDHIRSLASSTPSGADLRFCHPGHKEGRTLRHRCRHRLIIDWSYRMLIELFKTEERLFRTRIAGSPKTRISELFSQDFLMFLGSPEWIRKMCKVTDGDDGARTCMWHVGLIRMSIRRPLGTKL